MTAMNPLKGPIRLLAQAALTGAILLSAGCGDDGFIVISTGSGVIIFTHNSSAKR